MKNEKLAELSLRELEVISGAGTCYCFTRGAWKLLENFGVGNQYACQQCCCASGLGSKYRFSSAFTSEIEVNC